MLMKGMSLQQYCELVEFVQKYHRFGWVPDGESIQMQTGREKGEKHQLHIKYIDSCYDSRDSDIWVVTFRGFDNLRFAANHFAAADPPDHFKFTSLFDWVMAYLKGEWTNKNILDKCRVERD